MDLTQGDGLAEVPFERGVARGVDASTRAPWKTLRDQRLEFAYVLATDGRAPNESFADNWRTLRACGIAHGAYHFFRPRHDPDAQAQAFLAALGDDHGDLPPVIDIEQPPDCAEHCCATPCEYYGATIARWLRAVESAFGRRAMVYAVEPYWKECLCNTSRFADRPLWLPGFPDFVYRSAPGYGGWQRWELYQYRGNVRVAGALVDLDMRTR